MSSLSTEMCFHMILVRAAAILETPKPRHMWWSGDTCMEHYFDQVISSCVSHLQYRVQTLVLSDQRVRPILLWNALSRLLLPTQ